jgi:hypothetical protein
VLKDRKLRLDDRLDIFAKGIMVSGETLTRPLGKS